MKVQIKKINSEASIPQYQTPDSAGFDLASSADIMIAPGQIAKIPTGLVIAAPKGYFLLIAARSSLSLKKGLTMSNGIGIIDSDYAGPTDEIMIMVYNITPSPVMVKKGERLAQGLLIPVQQAEWEEVLEMKAGDRGGMGSTGGYKQ